MYAEVNRLIADFVHFAGDHFQKAWATLIGVIEDNYHSDEDLEAHYEQIAYQLLMRYYQLINAATIRASLQKYFLAAYWVTDRHYLSLYEMSTLKPLLAQVPYITDSLISWGADRIRVIHPATTLIGYKKYLAEILDNIQKKITVVAETEFHRLAILGLINAAILRNHRQLRWITAEDERVCEECGPKHGHIYPIAQTYGLIPLHPRCRCEWEEVIIHGES